MRLGLLGWVMGAVSALALAPWPQALPQVAPNPGDIDEVFPKFWSVSDRDLETTPTCAVPASGHTLTWIVNGASMADWRLIRMVREGDQLDNAFPGGFPCDQDVVSHRNTYCDLDAGAKPMGVYRSGRCIQVVGPNATGVLDQGRVVTYEPALVSGGRSGQQRSLFCQSPGSCPGLGDDVCLDLIVGVVRFTTWQPSLFDTGGCGIPFQELRTGDLYLPPEPDLSGVLGLFCDPDQDGEPTFEGVEGCPEAQSHEADCYSHPLDASSTCSSDDDGDGIPNEDESVNFHNTKPLCNGAFGISAECTPDGFGAGCLDVFPCQGPTGDVWFFDRVCVGALTGPSGRSACRDSSYYGDALLAPPYDGDVLTDGWGWRRVEVGLFPQPVTYVKPCEVSDLDEDGFPRFKVCEYVIQFPDTEEEPTGVEFGPFGDPDDGDPNDPLDTESPQDADQDGYSNAEELEDGSDPARAGSTPVTDDDYDGLVNGQDAHPNGAYGVSLPSPAQAGWFTYYPAPCGFVVPAAYFCYVEEEDRVYYWDPFCLDFEGCNDPATQQAQPASGNLVDDGYGYRYVQLVDPPVPEYVNVTAFVVCDVADADGDGIPVVSVCYQNATAYPVFSLHERGGVFLGPAGDPDDETPHLPDEQDLEELQQELEDLQEFILGEVAVLVGQVLSELAQVQEFVNDTLDFIRSRLSSSAFLKSLL